MNTSLNTEHLSAELQSALKSFTEGVERRIEQFRPEQASDAEKALLEDLAVSMEELRAISEELKEQAARVDREKRRNEILFDAAPYPYLITDLDGTIQQANRASVAFFGRHPDRIKGKQLAGMIALSERQAFREYLTRLGRTREDAWGEWSGAVERPGAPARASFRLRVSAGGEGGDSVFWIVRQLD